MRKFSGPLYLAPDVLVCTRVGLRMRYGPAGWYPDRAVILGFAWRCKHVRQEREARFPEYLGNITRFADRLNRLPLSYREEQERWFGLTRTYASASARLSTCAVITAHCPTKPKGPPTSRYPVVALRDLRAANHDASFVLAVAGLHPAAASSF
jgi:hypothetical protein